ncbi:MAG: hypothetical protein BWK80_08475 [Desulfobacteraceae bacterium IS3]|nr:MAG: hypothetical protein BWK80_08475 [Desulfobacteraceae bacterium IS3]
MDTAKKLPAIIDNRNDNTLLNALGRILPNAEKMDIAAGGFEIASFLMLEGLWQNLSKIRILTGDPNTRRTKHEILRDLLERCNNSIENEKIRDDSLPGLAAVRDALKNHQIMLKVWSASKFHAASYLMEAKENSLVDFAVTGSSDFSRQGLTESLELNLFTTDQAHIEGLRNWFNEIWKDAETASAELLHLIDPHLKDYDPFTIYAKSLFEFFAGKEKSQDEWEISSSAIYPLLSQYQKDGYHQSLQIAERWGGALICDGVGLGKTFIALMILERCLHEGKRLLLIVPKSAEESVWRANIRRYLEPHYSLEMEERLRIERHTSFGKEGLISEKRLDYYRKWTDTIIIDEAHHFRNPNANRGKLLMDITANKKLYMLTATPINNSLDDLYYLINYIAQNQPDHFASIRIRNLRKHFLSAEKRMTIEHPDAELSDIAEQGDFLRSDELLKNMLIQRSRKYVKQSEGISSSPLFPVRQMPKVISYSLKNVYAGLYGEIKEAFDRHRPFLSLAIYNTALYHNSPDPKIAGYQKLIAGLIRTLLLKRLESSFKSFEASVEDLLAKMADFLKYYSSERFSAWDATNRRWWKLVQDHIRQRLELDEKDTENEEEDEIPEFAKDFDHDQHDMNRLLDDILEDMNRLTGFLSKIYRRFYFKGQEGVKEDPEKDDKLQKLLQHLRENQVMKNQKIIIFSEFRNTARYLAKQLIQAGLRNVEQVDSGRNVKNREMIIKRFAPYYNCISDSAELSLCLEHPVDILISTDVLSEGLNLQDACLLINYDLHWNPVRLMQRIGRVDRRLNPDIEKMIKRPAWLKDRVFFWNFLPPDELEDLLHLKQKLDGKIFRINRTLGIEGALLTPDDPDMAMKLFNERYERKESVEELMRLEKERISSEIPEIWELLSQVPKRLFSGKKAGAGFGAVLNQKGEVVDRIRQNPRPGLFLCYRMPPVIASAAEDIFSVKNIRYKPGEHPAGEVKWYFRDAESGSISEIMEETWAAVRCLPDTERSVEQGVTQSAEARKAVEKHIKNTYLRDVQAPVGAKPELIAWMELF